MATTNLGLTLPTVGGDEDTWGDELNTAMTAVDAIFAANGTAVSLNIGAAKSMNLGGAMSAAAWTTAGIKLKQAAATYTDTSSSGTVADVRINNIGAPTLAASSASVFTDAYGTYFTNPVAGTNVTLTAAWAIGADSIKATTLKVTGTATVGILAGDSAILADTDAGTTARDVLDLFRNSASPADGDILNAVIYTGKSSTGVTRTYARAFGAIVSQANGTEDGRWGIQVISDGNPVTAFNVVSDETNSLNGFSTKSGGSMAFSPVGVYGTVDGILHCTRDQGGPLAVNRLTDDGTLVSFRRDSTEVGNITVTAGIVTLTSFVGSHWSQLSDNSTPDIKLGTVLSTIDEMVEWYSVPCEKNGERLVRKDCAAAKQETDRRLAKFEVSNVRGDKRVYGVFAGWDEDAGQTGDAIVHSVGASVIRVRGPVKGGDLLISAGDGTAIAQGDDIIRSNTIGKCSAGCTGTGENLVPCVLYCG